MRIETALKMLQEEYSKSKKLKFVRNPVAYALYQVWKKADAEKEQQEMNQESHQREDYTDLVVHTGPEKGGKRK